MKSFTASACGFVVSACLCGCQARAVEGEAGAAIDAVLDDWHRAASEADEERYIGQMTADGVFLGTDARERWTTPEFRVFVHPYFSKGQGWTYRPEDRHVACSPGGTTAWFDERLMSDKYGELRGTGVLRLVDGAWKIAHYSMTFVLPNELTPKIVEMIRDDDSPREAE